MVLTSKAGECSSSIPSSIMGLYFLFWASLVPLEGDGGCWGWRLLTCAPVPCQAVLEARFSVQVANEPVLAFTRAVPADALQ